MKITLLSTTNSRNAGGLFYSVRNLAIHLFRKKKYDINILSYNDNYSAKDISVYEEVPMLIYHLSEMKLLKKLGYSQDINKELELYAPDIIHQQGIWMYHSKASLNYKKKNKNVKTIVTPRGMLDPWLAKRSAFVKKIIRFWYENENLKRADCIHALCRAEYDSVRMFGLKNPIAILPNGTTLPNWRRVYQEKGKKTILFLGRIHPKKGIVEYITALGLIKKRNPSILEQWSFLLGGWSQEGHAADLEELIIKEELQELVKFIGPLYGKDKEKALKEADVFILPSHSEGMPMAILEAWAYGLPVIMTEYCNIPEGFSSKAAFRIDVIPELMSYQLETFFNHNNEQLSQMGKNGYKLVEEYFSWDVIADKTLELYRWLNGECMKPDFVFID